MTSKQAKKLYKGKHFYEIVKMKTYTKLYGPLDGIRYSADLTHFVEVIKGTPVRFFAKHVILITDRIL